MRAGELRHSVALQAPGGTSDAAGYQATTWTTQATVYAKVEPLAGREQFLAAQEQSQRSHMITVRYSSQVAALDETWSVLWGARRFLIELKRNAGERNRMIELLCIERPADQ